MAPITDLATVFTRMEEANSLIIKDNTLNHTRQSKLKEIESYTKTGDSKYDVRRSRTLLESVRVRCGQSILLLLVLVTPKSALPKFKNDFDGALGERFRNFQTPPELSALLTSVRNAGFTTLFPDHESTSAPISTSPYDTQPVSISPQAASYSLAVSPPTSAALLQEDGTFVDMTVMDFFYLASRISKVKAEDLAKDGIQLVMPGQPGSRPFMCVPVALCQEIFAFHKERLQYGK